MEVLFNLCEGWETCRIEELRDLYEKSVAEGDEFRLPSRQKLEALNKICASCKHCLELRGDECPVCGGMVLITPSFPLPVEFEAASTIQYFYRCIRCKKLLYSSKRIA
jgi:DNA-directed RNA polymerase subunit RPC12/RpoP